MGTKVDAWLAGNHSRRSLIRKFGELTGMLALCPWTLSGNPKPAAAQQSLTRADAATPLGKAHAAAIVASTDGPVDGSAFRAVQAAKQFSGITINLTFAK